MGVLQQYSTPDEYTEVISPEVFARVLPKKYSGTLNQDVMDSVNQLLVDPEQAVVFRENLLGYASVMEDGRFKVKDYINAVKYVSYKLTGDSNITAYTKTFPERYQYFINQGTSDKDIASYVSAYNKNKLVNLIMAQTLVPTHILNADLYQEAINNQAHLMRTAKSEKVRSDASDSLMKQLAPPVAAKVELDITTKETDSISELRATTLALVAQQREMLQSKSVNAREIAESSLVIDGELEQEDVWDQSE